MSFTDAGTPMADAYTFDGGPAPDDYKQRLYHIESSGNPQAWTTLPSGRKSQYRGLAQLGPDEEKAAGITDWQDPAQQARAVDMIWNRNGKFFTNTFGRPPTQAEQYLMHNQGAHGLSQMLSDPDANAASTVGASHISGNFPHQAFAGMDPKTITNRDYVNGWTSFFNGSPSSGQLPTRIASARGDTPPSLGSQPQMSDNYLAQALMGQQGTPQDQGPFLNGLRQFAGQPQGGGLSPMERAGIYLMSISNPSALQGLAAGNRDAEARNANALRAIGLVMQQRNQDRQDKRLEGQLAPKSIYGTPQDQSGAPAAPIYGDPASGGSGAAPAPAAPAAAPSGPSGAPGSNVYGMAGGSPIASLDNIAQGGAGSSTSDNEPAAMGAAPTGWNNYDPNNPGVATQSPAPQGGPQGQARLPSQADFDLAASRMRSDIANGMKPEDVLGRIHDQGLRELVKSWGEGGLNPDSTNRQYDPQTKAARSLAAAIYGDKGIETAWTNRQQQQDAWKKENDPNAAGSVMSKLNAMDNIHTNLFTNDGKNLPLTELYDKLGNWQLDSPLLAYGVHVPGVGNLAANSHPGKSGDYVPAFNNRVVNYMTDVLKLRLAGNSGGTAEERGAGGPGRSREDVLGDVDSGRSVFNKFMQPNEFRNALVSEMGQNIGDLQNKRTQAIESLGGVVNKDGTVTGSANAKEMAARIDKRISQAQHDLDTWLVQHPEQTHLPGFLGSLPTSIKMPWQ